MNRWRAAGIHLTLSIAVVGGIGAAAFLLWHPHGLYRVAGLDRILLVMLGIDLTAGPLLTLIVYKPDKPSLKFDLSVIALAQAAFLAYGLHTLSSGRPVFLVGTAETFTVVFANEIAPDDLALAPRPQWRRLSWFGPQLVGTRPPEDKAARSEAIERFMETGKDIERLPRYYMDFSTIAPLLLEQAAPLPDVNTGKELRQGVKLVLPVVSLRGEALMLVDPRTGEPVRAID